MRTGLAIRWNTCVALRKESVDRNIGPLIFSVQPRKSLSARRAWIEISTRSQPSRPRRVALRKESVDRNWYHYGWSWYDDFVALRKESVDRNLITKTAVIIRIHVALRKESVDRNFSRVISLPFSCMSQFSCSSVMPGILFFTSSRFMVETPFCG